MNTRDPYAEALEHLDAGRLTKALDGLHWAGRNLDPLAYDEVWAEVHLHRAENGKAAELAERTLAAGRDTPRLHRIAAVAQWRLGLRVEARAHAERSAGDDAWALYHRALIALEDRDWPDAEAFAARAATLKPEYSDAEGLRLYARAASGDRSASVLLRKLWEESRNPTILDWALIDADRRKEWGVADELAREVRALGVRDSHALNALLRHYVHRKSPDDVVAIYDEAPEALRSAPYVLQCVGWAFSAKGEYRAALPFLERLFELEPANPQYWRPYYHALNRTGQFRKAWKQTRISTQATERQSGGRFRFANLLHNWSSRRR